MHNEIRDQIWVLDTGVVTMDAGTGAKQGVMLARLVAMWEAGA